VTDQLDRVTLMREASGAAGLSDFGELPFEEALDMLIFSLEREAALDEARRTGTAAMIRSALIKRLMLEEDRKQFPEIADEVIEAPIFITGLPRTGSTNLHGLMATCEGVRAPRRWEMSRPSPPPEAATYESDPRIAAVHAAEIVGVSEELQKRHPMTADRPEQCQTLCDHAFMNWSLMAPYNLPTYRDWLLSADHRPSYETHKRTLQHLQFRHPGQWVLKYPKHVFALDALIAVYPDARLIWTHRDPAKVIPSVVSLIGAFRNVTPGYDQKLLGRSWAAFEELGLRRGLAQRDELFAPERVYDMYYRDVMQDPSRAIEAAYQHFDMAFSEQSRASILAYVADNPKDKHGAHSYTAEEFGLSDAVLRTTFKSYARRFGI
jgi:Sulfotransferase family